MRGAESPDSGETAPTVPRHRGVMVEQPLLEHTSIAHHEAASTMALPTRSIVPDEPLPLAMRRITVGLLGKAIADLRPTDQESFDPGVHSARKGIKRLRGILRLVRDGIGYRAYREENVMLRNTARTLSAVRDAWVLVDTLRSLRKRYGDLLDDATFATPEAWLLSRHMERHELVTGQVVTNAIVSLGTARSRFGRFPIEGIIRNDFSAIAEGIERVYRRGHRGLKHASATRDVHDLHEWRKRVKYLRYQMEALTPMYPTLIGSTAQSLDELGELLGDDHDLAVLAETILEHPESCRDERERWMLIALIHERRTNLQAQALSIGTALYVEKPGAFVNRIGAYWEAGRR
jgi:CHAD domain-containing protein